MGLFAYDLTIVCGAAAKDCEMRFTPNGQAVSSFSVPVDRSYKDKTSGELVKRTIWYRITVYGTLAEMCNERIRKGTKVLVVGEMTPDWATGNPRIYKRQDGTEGASYEVNAREVKFLSSKSGEQSAQDDGDVPF
jgi:single-strand DNA-binding protein